jgi:hypothetical protein
MPGNLANSPALTFAPLDVPGGRQRTGGIAVGDDGAALRAYRTPWCGRSSAIIFARLDRQIVLVDALAAFNSGPRRCTISSGARRHSRLLPHRAIDLRLQPVSAAHRPYCLPQPKRTTCII